MSDRVSQAAENPPLTFPEALKVVNAYLERVNPGDSVIVARRHIDRDGRYFDVTMTATSRVQIGRSELLREVREALTRNVELWRAYVDSDEECLRLAQKDDQPRAGYFKGHLAAAKVALGDLQQAHALATLDQEGDGEPDRQLESRSDAAPGNESDQRTHGDPGPGQPEDRGRRRSGDRGVPRRDGDAGSRDSAESESRAGCHAATDRRLADPLVAPGDEADKLEQQNNDEVEPPRGARIPPRDIDAALADDGLSVDDVASPGDGEPEADSCPECEGTGDRYYRIRHDGKTPCRACAGTGKEIDDPEELDAALGHPAPGDEAGSTDTVTVTIPRKLAEEVDAGKLGPRQRAADEAVLLAVRQAVRATPTPPETPATEPPKTFAELRDRFIDPEKEQLRAELARFREKCSHVDTTLNGNGTMTCDLCGQTEPDSFAATPAQETEPSGGLEGGEEWPNYVELSTKPIGATWRVAFDPGQDVTDYSTERYVRLRGDSRLTKESVEKVAVELERMAAEAQVEAREEMCGDCAERERGREDAFTVAASEVRNLLAAFGEQSSDSSSSDREVV